MCSAARGRAAGRAVVVIFYQSDWWSYCNGQLAVMARQYGEYLRRGATITEVVVDAPEQNTVMAKKLTLAFRSLTNTSCIPAFGP
jgi:peroxiredoxin